MENATPPHRGLKSQIVETLNLAEVEEMCHIANHFEICESNSSMNVDADSKNKGSSEAMDMFTNPENHENEQISCFAKWNVPRPYVCVNKMLRLCVTVDSLLRSAVDIILGTPPPTFLCSFLYFSHLLFSCCSKNILCRNIGFGHVCSVAMAK